MKLLQKRDGLSRCIRYADETFQSLPKTSITAAGEFQVTCFAHNKLNNANLFTRPVFYKSPFVFAYN